VILMKILHYSLGLPPYRTGGLAKYSIDLINSQLQANHEVFLLFPGHFNITKKTLIRLESEIQELKVFEIVNPLPISLLGGIGDPIRFMKSVYPKDIYHSFLSNVKPDIIHIHTLMGIHKEFFMAAKELNIKLVFTTHDYYGICPKVNLLDYNEDVCIDNDNGKKCIICNQNAYSLPLIYLMQSKTYRMFKDNELIKKMRKRKNEAIKEQSTNTIQKDGKIDSVLANKFNNLRDYYFEIFHLIDYFHFNSENTKNEFEKYFDIKGAVLPVSHSDITDNRENKFYNENKPLKISFLGPLDKYKGFPLLRESLNRLLSRGQMNWELNVYGNSMELALEKIEKEHIFYHGRYQHTELKNIFANTDILIVPSVWKETFGFIGLEALAFGVPVIVSNNVGFKDVIQDGKTGIIFNPESKELSSLIESLIRDRKILQSMNQNICNEDFPYTLEKHAKDIESLYKEVIGVLA